MVFNECVTGSWTMLGSDYNGDIFLSHAWSEVSQTMMMAPLPHEPAESQDHNCQQDGDQVQH